MSLSILIPCKNEEDNLENTVEIIKKKISKKIKNYEFVIIDDFSNDNTSLVCRKLSSKNKNFIYKNNKVKGLGGAINLGIKVSRYKYIAIMMADLSDSPNDLIKYYNIITKKKLDAVFGSRFLKDSKVNDYPLKKLIFNRFFNYIVKYLFFSKYNDFTNAFKIYKKEVLIEIKPLVSENFNIFLEMPLKIITRKKKFQIIPISWKNRKKGSSKFKIKELSSKYFFTLFYCLLEKILLR